MNQKKITLITLGIVVAGAVAINEFIMRNAAQQQERDVASLGERFEPEQIKWEQELAKAVSKDGGKTLFGMRPTMNDKFMFEALEGRYEAQVVEGKLLKINLMPNQTALVLKTDTLIRNYSDIFKSAQSFEATMANMGTENVILKNSTGKAIGKVVIARDEQGRVLHIEIE